MLAAMVEAVGLEIERSGLESVDKHVGHARIEHNVPEDESEQGTKRGRLGVFAVRVPVGLVDVVTQRDLLHAFYQRTRLVSGGCFGCLRLFLGL